MSFMAHPVLEGLFSHDDHARVAMIQAVLSAERLVALRSSPAGLYDPEFWQQLGRLGLFRLGLPDEGELTLRATGRAVAMMADCLANDVVSELDLAIYVHGLVAMHTLYHHRDTAAARALIEPAACGDIVFCTAYTDADPATPTFGVSHAGGYRLRGRKWLSVNMPHAHVAMVTFQTETQACMAILPLDGEGTSRHALQQHGNASIYSQGTLDLDDVFVPHDHVVSGGLKRLRIWNRVMTASRLLNAASAFRSLSRLIECVNETLGDRPIAGQPFHSYPDFRRFVAEARTAARIQEAALVSVLAGLGSGRIDEAAIAGLKATSVRDSLDLAARALDLAGGAGTLADSEIARLATSLSHHRFSSGGEAQLMAFYATGIGRGAALALGGVAA